jgi:hypothetical protein
MEIKSYRKNLAVLIRALANLRGRSRLADFGKGIYDGADEITSFRE